MPSTLAAGVCGAVLEHASVAGRRARRPDDHHSVALGDWEQSLHIGGARKRRRQHPLGRRLADLVQEALEEEGLEVDQCLRPVGLTDEGVGRLAATTGTRSRSTSPSTSATPISRY
jgi:hypothetical protein